MPRFHARDDAVARGRAVLTGDDAHHLARVLRVRHGEQIVVVAGDFEHGVAVDRVSERRVEGAVTWTRHATGDPTLEVHVLQALLKDGMDEAIDAMVEAGVAAVHPVISARTVARPDERRAEGRLARWQAVAQGAAGQAFRATVPVVEPLRPLHRSLEALPADATILLCDVGGSAARPLAGLAVDGVRPVVLCIGPEGGWDEADRRLLRELNPTPVHLGPRVLRARLAGAIATTLVLASSGDMAAAWSPPPD